MTGRVTSSWVVHRASMLIALATSSVVTNLQPAGGTVEVPVHYLIDVDGGSGRASIDAQG